MRELQHAVTPEHQYRVSTFCHGGGCVGVASDDHGSILVVNTTTADQGQLRFTAAEWDAFVAGVKNGEFDRAVL
jgi:hypothetical protein